MFKIIQINDIDTYVNLYNLQIQTYIWFLFTNFLKSENIIKDTHKQKT